MVQVSFVGVLGLSLAVLTWLPSRHVATPHRHRPGRGGQGSTTLDDQVDLNVTVYNSDIALVRDVRNSSFRGARST